MSSCFLATYRPLVMNRDGREAIRRHAFPPFIDGSCRREPDFESLFPSITATCRGRNFAPRLQDGDRIAYLTAKGKYLDDSERGWRLVAVLKVIKRLSSHREAAAWYAEKRQPLPSNCFVEGNLPKPYEFTNGDPPAKIKKQVAATGDFARAIRLWDRTYRRRITDWPVFLVTQADFIELNNPPQLHEEQLRAVFGKIPGTRNPPNIACEKRDRLVKLAIG